MFTILRTYLHEYEIKHISSGSLFDLYIDSTYQLIFYIKKKIVIKSAAELNAQRNVCVRDKCHERAESQVLKNEENKNQNQNKNESEFYIDAQFIYCTSVP